MSFEVCTSAPSQGCRCECATELAIERALVLFVGKMGDGSHAWLLQGKTPKHLICLDALKAPTPIHPIEAARGVLYVTAIEHHEPQSDVRESKLKELDAVHDWRSWPRNVSATPVGDNVGKVQKSAQTFSKVSEQARCAHIH